MPTATPRRGPQAGLAPRTCPICSTVYVPYRDSQKACSRKCREQLPEIRARIRNWQVTPEARERKNAARRLETASDPKARSAKNRRSALARYGITPEQYDEQVERQHGRCMICGRIPDPARPKPANRLHVDHDHKTAARRDLLCSRCNTAIGLMADDPGLFRAAADYIERHKGV